MRVFVLLAAVAVNVAFVLLAALTAASEGVSVAGRASAAVVVVALAAAVAALLMAYRGRLPPWGANAMRVLCIAVPILWLVGSVSHRMLAAQELVFLGVVSLVAWATWRVFKKVQAVS